MTPISTRTTMAITIAPRRPNIHQPTKNAIIEPKPMWDHCTVIGIPRHSYFLTVLASNVTADCANALPSRVAPVFRTIVV